MHAQTNPLERIERLIRPIPDFPKPGILFRDITPMLADPGALALAVELMANPFRGRKLDLVVGAESRGFIFGIALAQSLACGFVPVRKPGKLPWKTVRESYALEYGTDSIEIHHDAVTAGERVIIVDDLLATGGTLGACAKLVRSLGGDIAACLVVIELGFLKGRERVAPHEVRSLLRY